MVLLLGNGEGIREHVPVGADVLRARVPGETGKTVRARDSPTVHNHAVGIFSADAPAPRALALPLLVDLLERVPEVQGARADLLGRPAEGTRDIEEVPQRDSRRDQEIRRRVRGLLVADENGPSHAVPASLSRPLSAGVPQD